MLIFMLIFKLIFKRFSCLSYLYCWWTVVITYVAMLVDLLHIHSAIEALIDFTSDLSAIMFVTTMALFVVPRRTRRIPVRRHWICTIAIATRAAPARYSSQRPCYDLRIVDYLFKIDLKMNFNCFKNCFYLYTYCLIVMPSIHYLLLRICWHFFLAEHFVRGQHHPRQQQQQQRRQQQRQRPGGNEGECRALGHLDATVSTTTINDDDGGDIFFKIIN